MLLKVEPFEAGLGCGSDSESSPEVVLFTGVGEGAAADVLVVGSPGERV